MRTTIFNLIITMLMAGTIFTGCQSPAQKEEAAEAKLQNAEKNFEEAQNDAEAQKVATAAEWEIFKSETNLTIKKNEISIAQLKIKIKKPGKTLDALYAKRIDTLEQKNKELKTRMESYEKSQSDWEIFKREFNHDMDELGKALEDLTIDNKK